MRHHCGACGASARKRHTSLQKKAKATPREAFEKLLGGKDLYGDGAAINVARIMTVADVSLPATLVGHISFGGPVAKTVIPILAEATSSAAHGN